MLKSQKKDEIDQIRRKNEYQSYSFLPYWEVREIGIGGFCPKNYKSN